MKYLKAKHCDQPSGQTSPTQPGTGEMLRASCRTRDHVGFDYSEEAIPERDPAYHLPSGTDSPERTVETLSVEARRELACRLQQLGMSWARAAAVASL